MVKKLIYILLITVIMIGMRVSAQDVQFSQYYAAPLYLNPALAGINQIGRAGINYRSQWPGVDASFETFSAYIDNNWDEKNSSLGLLFTSDLAGIGSLRATEVALQYAYQARLNPFWTFRPAFQVSYASRSIDYTRLIFGDQLDNNGLTGNPTNESFAGNSTSYFDLGLGGIVFSEQSWLGLAVHHLLEPNQSLGTGTSELPRKISIHGGYKIPLRTDYKRGETASGKEKSVSPTFNYKAQGQFQQLDLGAYFTYSPVIFGMWYRGIPLTKNIANGSNSEAIIAMIGLTRNQFNFGYSFDYTLSDLGISSGGAHEISMTYTFRIGDPRKPSRNVRELRCPVPYMF